jgi:SPP1 family predicted phage head-tail adaptor
MQPRRLSTNRTYTPTGAMTTRVTLSQPSEQRGPTGEFIQQYEPFATCWASIEMLAAKYTEKTQLVIAEATHKVTIRYLPVTPSMTVILPDGRIWNIEAVFDPDERKVELQLFCYERNKAK